MTDWAHPVLSDTYSSVLTTYLNGRDVDAITLQFTPASNPPTHAIKLLRAPVKFQDWNGASYDDLLLDVTGGGTGAANAAAARTNLGLGTMATQNSTGVAITGGSISGVTLDAAVITSGVVALARGGTGASLALGAAGEFLQSIAGAVGFGHDGSNLNNLNATNITAGTLNVARLPAGFGGRYIQIQQRTTTAAQTVSSNGVYQNITQGFVTITPTSVTSRVLVKFNQVIMLLINTPVDQAWVSARIKRNGVVIATFANLCGSIFGAQGTNIEQAIYPLEILDSPATIALITYQLEVKCTNNVGTTGLVLINPAIGADLPLSVYTVEEIGPN